MEKLQLASHLRERQATMTDGKLRQQLHLSNKGIQYFRQTLQTISDDDIIDSYITCSCCGEKQVKDKRQLDLIIAASNSVDEFFELCNHFSMHASVDNAEQGSIKS